MKKKIFYIIGLFIILMIIFTIPNYATTATVTTDTLNLRKEASTTSSVLELLNKNTTVEVISQDGDWCKVQHGNNVGYVNKQYIKIEEKENTNDTVNNNTITNSTNSVTNTISENTTMNITTEDSSNEIKNELKQDTNIKILPSINSNVIGELKNGDEVTVISKTNNWAFIQLNDIAGWITLTSLQEKTENKVEENSETNTTVENTTSENTTSEPTTTSNESYTKSTKYVNTTSVYVRSKASTSSDIVTTLIKNTDVTVVGEEGEWYKVTYNNLTGYIRKDLLADKKLEETSRSATVERTTTEETSQNNSSDTSRGQQVVSYAKQYLNCPYVYGASGPSCFDCSGFTMYVYRHFGYTLSHSAVAQSNCGTKVEKSNLQAGDLVFFEDYETKDGIGHCGIYIGDGNFIQASSGTGYCVKISTLLSGSYYNRYITARRIL